MALSSTKQLSQTLIGIPIITFIFLFLGLHAAAPTNFVGSESLKVSPPEFAGSVRDIVDILHEVTSILSEFGGGTGFGDSRVSNAISDCLDLLDLSSDALDWSVSATETPKGTNHCASNTLFSTLSFFNTCIVLFKFMWVPLNSRCDPYVLLPFFQVLNCQNLIQFHQHFLFFVSLVKDKS